MTNYSGTNVRTFQKNAIQITAQPASDGLDEFWINIELRNERTGNRVPEFCGAVDALEQSLRTFREAFAFFIQLTQHLQARSLFGECAMEPGKILFRLRSEEHTSEL